MDILNWIGFSEQLDLSFGSMSTLEQLGDLTAEEVNMYLSELSAGDNATLSKLEREFRMFLISRNETFNKRNETATSNKKTLLLSH